MTITMIKKQRRPMPALFFCLLALSFGCGPKPQTFQTAGPIMGTTYAVKMTAKNARQADKLAIGIEETLNRVNALMSNWVDSSDISRFNRYRDTTPMDIDEETAKVIANALDIAQRSNGALDPTVSPLIELWGFGQAENVTFPEDQAITEALAKTGYTKLNLEGTSLSKTNPDLTLNLGANAKGYAVDAVAEYLLSEGITEFMVEVGGEVRVAAPETRETPWRIGINDPNQPRTTALYTIAGLRNMAMATSGDYRNYFDHEGVRYSHLIDPRTGRPIPARITSVTVFAKDCTTADALATALMVMPEEEGMALVESMQDVEAFMLLREADGETLTEQKSSGADALLVEEDVQQQ